MSINMRIGINGTGSLATLDQVLAEAKRTEADGFDSFWIAQIFGMDALTALAVVGREVPRIELGTAVVPTYPRHPMMMAGQALTLHLESGCRIRLLLSHCGATRMRSPFVTCASTCRHSFLCSMASRLMCTVRTSLAWVASMFRVLRRRL